MNKFLVPTNCPLETRSCRRLVFWTWPMSRCFFFIILYLFMINALKGIPTWFASFLFFFFEKELNKWFFLSKNWEKKSWIKWHDEILVQAPILSCVLHFSHGPGQDFQLSRFFCCICVGQPVSLPFPIGLDRPLTFLSFLSLRAGPVSPFPFLSFFFF